MSKETPNKLKACTFCNKTVDEVMFLAYNEKAGVCDGCAVAMVGQAVQQSYSNALLLRKMSQEVVRLQDEKRVKVPTDAEVEAIIREQNDSGS